MAVAPLMATAAIPESVTGIVVFGSYSRGDYDAQSDLDLLVVVKDGSGTTPERQIIEAIRSSLPKEPSVSFYGERKLQALFEEGNLFAWHLFLEARGVEWFPRPSAVLKRPNPYATSLEDIGGLVAILEGVSSQVARNPWNAVFESGILYVCARNIAMSASWHLKARPDFGRYSPFELPKECRFPLSEEQYDLAMRCRMASTRGEAPPNVTSRTVEAMSAELSPWAHAVADLVRTSG